jgi:hypothetical protein
MTNYMIFRKRFFILTFDLLATSIPVVYLSVAFQRNQLTTDIDGLL